MMQLNNFSRGMRYRRSRPPFAATHRFEFGAERMELMHFARKAKYLMPNPKPGDRNAQLSRHVAIENRRAYVLGRLLRTHNLTATTHPIEGEWGW